MKVTKTPAVIITGAGRGIGKEIAFACAREKMNVVILSKHNANAVKVCDEIVNVGGTAISFEVDITNFKQVYSAVQESISHFGSVEYLVNNAGITKDAFFEKMTCSQWLEVINTNLNGTFYCIKAVVPSMLERGYGRIVNISSIAGELGAVAQSNYSASKAGIIGLTKSLAQELGEKGILVNAICPGFITTDMTGGIPEKIRLKAIQKIGSASDIASACIHLLSNDYCNGTIMNVNGGIATW